MLFDNDKALLECQLNLPIINQNSVSGLGIVAFQNPKKE
jgi:hypothetical protein